MNSFQNLLVVDALHLGLEVGTNFKRASHGLIVLRPKAAAAISRKTGGPGVAIFVGFPEGVA
jgi:hypothetical protein